MLGILKKLLSKDKKKNENKQGVKYTSLKSKKNKTEYKGPKFKSNEKDRRLKDVGKD